MAILGSAMRGRMPPFGKLGFQLPDHPSQFAAGMAVISDDKIGEGALHGTRFL